MLQKILFALASVVMMVVSAVVPSLHAPADDAGGAPPGGALVTERVVTRGYAPDHDFARISVLTVEIDGRLALEDAVGRGSIEELRFKVGVKRAEGNTLAIGDQVVDLKPTDVITIRDFNGRFELKGMRTTQATLALDGTVARTLLSEGENVKQVRTEANARLGGRQLTESSEGLNLPFVVLDGRPVNTVSVNRGGSERVFTAPEDPLAAETETGAILAKWVKVDGKLVTQYTWGDGPVGKIEFEPAESPQGVSLNWSGGGFPLGPSGRVVVTEFLGGYRISQVPGGAMKLQLDGYAQNVTTAARNLGENVFGDANKLPIANFSLAPGKPTTDDTVRFTDLSLDPDGVIVYRKWDFGDGQGTVLQHPRHRYAKPGVYTVSLQVTDNNLATSYHNTTLFVGSTPPVADWDFTPKRATSLDPIQFIDKSWDPDGQIQEYAWNFGDGTTSGEKDPVHQYTENGDYTVTLRVVDDHGLETNLSKVLRIENAPPTARFTYDPPTPVSGTTLNFTDASTDVDGEIRAWSWDFGDGVTSPEQSPQHTFYRSGIFAVTLTVTDDDGATSTFASQVAVENRPPRANFTWSPGNVTTSTPVAFQDLSVDPDGTIKTWSWNFGNGHSASQPSPVHRFTSAGTYQVCLTVKDDHQQTSFICRSLAVDNSAPLSDFTWATNPLPYAKEWVPFQDLSRDVDGDAITNWTWTFGDGTAPSWERNPHHRFDKAGTYPVTLQVVDARGKVGNVTKSVQILNNRPVSQFNATPTPARAGESIQFNATAEDRDGNITGYQWDFGDGNTTAGPNATHTYSQPGTYTVTLTVTDDDGGHHVTSQQVRVERAVATANFTYTPSIPTAGQRAAFYGTAEGGDRPIVAWAWTFDDVQTNDTQNATVVFPTSRTYEVTLKITDSEGVESIVSKPVYVNDPPQAAIRANTTTPKLHHPVKFTDRSTDKEGNLTAWFWDFGDGNTSTAQHPEHAYSTGGRKVVTLTVTDSHGVTGTTNLTLDVENKPPTADFLVSPPAPVAGSEAQFTSVSTDPDALDPPEAWRWEFGDGNTSTQRDPVHVYERSGHYVVNHTVSDGDAWAATAQRTVRVTSPHEVCYTVKALLPNGRHLNFSHENATLTLKLIRLSATTVFYTKANATITPDGHADLCIPGGTWAVGDSFTITISMDGNTATLDPTRTFTTENPPDLELELPLRLSLAPTVHVNSGTRTSYPVSLWLNRTPMYPTYQDPTEQVTGGGHVTWADGTPAGWAEVQVQVRYVGFRLFREDGVLPASQPVTGWCDATVLRTDAGGNFTYALPFYLPCLPPMAQEGVMLPGWWEVRVRASYPAIAGNPSATPGFSPYALFFEDPFGAQTGRFGNPTPP